MNPHAPYSKPRPVWLLISPVLDMLNSGGFLRKAIALGIQIASGLFVLMTMLSLITVLKFAFQEGIKAAATLGLLMFAGICIGAMGVCVQIMLYRAMTIREIEDGTGFVIMPVVSLLLRMAGELYATLMVSLGIGGCLTIWLGEINPVGMMGALAPNMLSIGASSGFLGGVTLAVFGCLGGFAALVGFYFLAELAIVLASIARDMRALATKVGA